MDYRELVALRADVEAAIHEAVDDMAGAILSRIEGLERRMDDLEDAHSRGPSAATTSGRK